MSKQPVKKIAKASTLTNSESSTSIEETYRKPARAIKALSDKSIQRLMWECQTETLMDFLWYMKDGDLIKQIIRNLAEHAGTLLIEEMTSSWRYGNNPDTAPKSLARKGREAAQDLLERIRDLIAEGTIENVLGEE